MSTTFDKGVEAFATVGRIRAYIGAFVGVLVGVVLIALGVTMRRNPHTVPSDAKVTDVVCRSSPMATKTPLCSYEIQYGVNGQAMFTTLQLPQGKYVKNQMITVFYDPANVHSIDVDIADKRRVGLILIIVGVVVPLVGLLTLYFSRKSETFAAVEGAGAVWRGVF